MSILLYLFFNPRAKVLIFFLSLTASYGILPILTAFYRFLPIGYSVSAPWSGNRADIERKPSG